MKTSVRLPLQLRKGAKISVVVDPKNPYTVLYDKAAKRILGVVKTTSKGASTITIKRAVPDVRSLLLVGTADEKSWKATKTALDKGGDGGAPGSAGNGTGKIID
jgi:hypothetical protein